MLSLVCAYNNEDKLKSELLSSLKFQKNVKYELILVNTVKENIKSASEALNRGGKQAKGEYIVFLHQDIIFEDDNTLHEIEEYCNSYQFGIAGVAGVNIINKSKDFKVYTNIVHGLKKRPAGMRLDDAVMDAKSLDECLLVIPRKIFEKYQFRYIGNTWHLYGTDYAIQMQEINEKVVIFPIELGHSSPGDSLSADYYDAVIKLAHFCKKERTFYTVFGKWPTNKILLTVKCIYRKLRYYKEGI